MLQKKKQKSFLHAIVTSDDWYASENNLKKRFINSGETFVDKSNIHEKKITCVHLKCVLR